MGNKVYLLGLILFTQVAYAQEIPRFSGTPVSGNCTEWSSDGYIVDAGVTCGGHSDGANCSAGNYPLGVDATGAVQSCTADANTNADTECSGSTTYMDGDGGCDDISSVYSAAAHTHVEANITDLTHTTDTNANTLCSGTDVYLDGEGNCDTISGGGGSSSWTIFYGVNTASQTHASTATLSITFGSEERKDSGFTHSTSTNPENITIDAVGWYKVSWGCSFESDYANRIAYRGYITKAGTAQAGCFGYGYSRQGNTSYARHATVNGSCLIETTAINQVVNLRTQIYDNGGGAFGSDTQDTDTIIDECFILIQKEPT